MQQAQNETEDKLRNSFRPKIGRGPFSKRRSERVSIHEHLYNYKSIYQNNKESLLQNSNTLKPGFRMPKSNNHSDEIVEHTISAKISQFFETIDHDCNGVITADDCESWAMLYKCIPEEIMTVLGDLVDELRKEESHIDTENFIAYFRNKMTCIPSKVISLFNQYLGVTGRPKCSDDNTYSVSFFFLLGLAGAVL
jgi:hypothetical protein